MRLTRRQWMAGAGTSCLTKHLGATEQSKRSFWVFGLLRPTSVTVNALGTSRLHCCSQEEHWDLEGIQRLTVSVGASPIRIAGPAQEAVGFILEVPGVIRRAFTGTVEIFGEAGIVAAVVTMDCECATGSIVGAELPVERCADSGLTAQAVVSRSILCAATKPRHNFADFCDTTHCQFLRSPAAPSSKVWQATQASKGIILTQQGRIFPARYSAACGGMTEDGMDGDFRYVAVDCAVCRRDGNVRRGHGWGLCQEGAMGLTELGWSWREIVAHYYPNSRVSHAPLQLL